MSMFEEKTREGGVIRLEDWGDNYVLWFHGELVWCSNPMPVNTPPKALTVNTSTPGNDLEYNGLAATRIEEVEKRLLKLELAVSILMPDRSNDI